MNETAPITRYTNTTEQLNQVQRSFTYQPPKDDQPARYVILREHAKAFAHLLLEFVPPSRERSVALTRLEESVMWANKAIAVNETPIQQPLG